MTRHFVNDIPSTTTTSAADGTGDPDGEVFGDETEDQGQAAAVGAQDPDGGETFGSEPGDDADDVSDEGVL